MQTLPPALAGLAAYRQFVVYVLTPDPAKPGKMKKQPFSPTLGYLVTAHDPAHWLDFPTAAAYVAQLGASYGVGFVFTANDPYFFFDADGCRDPNTGAWSAISQKIVSMFPGAGMELSTSGTGMHIVARANRMPHGCKNKGLGLELYTEKRFIALTGLGTLGDVDTDHTLALAQLIGEYFPFDGDTQDVNGDFTLSTAPVPEWRGPSEDGDLIRRALASRSAGSVFGDRASFRDLWERNVPVLAVAYPEDEPDKEFGYSEAEAALAAHLSFWTGRHGERIQRLMMQSGLKREKFDRPDYLPRTITRVLAKAGDVCQDKEIALPAHLQPVGAFVAPLVVPTAEMQPVGPDRTSFIGTDGAIQLFRGCVYIKDEGRALVPGCGRMPPERFKVVFGGYTFAMDDSNQRTTRNSWEAFTESQLLRPPMADSTCFRPDLPAGTIVTDAGRTRVNIYEPVEVARQPGDLTPFFAHLEKLLPDNRDRLILLSYMAACVQHKGVKFQWAPLLQGVEGNGKTLFTRCVAEALGRRYVHWPKASKLSKEFNAWMVGKLLYGVEDIYTPHGKNEVIEELKPMITGGDGLEIEGKGVDQVSMDICGNFMFNSNHKDAIKKTRNDRRFCVFYSAQQEDTDLARDGLDGDYFPKLYDWLYAEGYAIVSEFLHTVQIPPEFNPARGCHRAPKTSTTEQAIHESQGGVEQHIAEAVAQGRPGFAGGWISSIQLNTLLEELKQGQRITLNKRRAMLRHLGYEMHKGLPEGRVNSVVLPDSGRPQLFVRTGIPDAFLTSPAEIAKAYTQAQK